MANLNAIAIARSAKARECFDYRQEGLYGGERMMIYGSKETHNWCMKTIDILGLGRKSFRAIETDEHFRVRIDLLREAIRKDRAAGLQPFCVIGSAGTVNSGAVDDLDALADLCQEEGGLWFHIDGAFGAMAYLSPSLRDLVKGLSRADSVVVDLHKVPITPPLHHSSHTAPPTANTTN